MHYLIKLIILSILMLPTVALADQEKEVGFEQKFDSENQVTSGIFGLLTKTIRKSVKNKRKTTTKSKKDNFTKREAPSIKEQAKEIQHKLNSDKTSVTIKTEQNNIHTHYDLSGPTHKGVETPHKQYSEGNTDANGLTRYNKLRKKKDTHDMTQQDIRTVRQYLERKN